MTDIQLRTAGASRPPSPGARMLSVIGLLRRWTLRLGLAAVVAAAVIVYAVVRDGYPDGGQAVVATLAIVAALVPAIMLAVFWLALGQLLELPDRIRNLPYDGREHGMQLRSVFEQARAGRGRRFSTGRTMWQLLRLTSAARETLTPYTPLLPFFSVPFLFAVAFAMWAAAVELLIACVLAIMLAVG
jgi:hypothetical protein